MALTEITDNQIEHECEACGTIRKVAIDEITAGIKRDDQISPLMVPMTPCPSCGAKEFFVGSAKDDPDHPSPGSFGHRHRLMVDVLRSRLLKSGRVVEGLDPEKDEGREPTAEELDRWFKGKLRLERRQEKGKPEDKSAEGLHCGADANPQSCKGSDDSTGRRTLVKPGPSQTEKPTNGK